MAGEDFALEVTARVAGLERRHALAALEHATAARLVAEIPEEVGRYGFAHALVREALYDGLSVARRASLHERTGEVLEEIHRDAPQRLAEIAWHYLRAAPLGDLQRALRCAQRAGEWAMATLGWDEAAQHFEQALGVFNLKPAVHPEERRCDLKLSLGRARARAGRTKAARGAFLAAADLAHATGDAVRLAEAALGLGTVSPVWASILSSSSGWSGRGTRWVLDAAILDRSFGSEPTENPIVIRDRAAGRPAGAFNRSAAPTRGAPDRPASAVSTQPRRASNLAG